MEQDILEYNVIFQEESEGGFFVFVPFLPGCIAQGETFEDTMKNICEAILLYLEDKDINEIQDDKINSHKQFMVPVRVISQKGQTITSLR